MEPRAAFATQRFVAPGRKSRSRSSRRSSNLQHFDSLFAVVSARLFPPQRRSGDSRRAAAMFKGIQDWWESFTCVQPRPSSPEKGRERNLSVAYSKPAQPSPTATRMVSAVLPPLGLAAAAASNDGETRIPSMKTPRAQDVAYGHKGNIVEARHSLPTPCPKIAR